MKKTQSCFDGAVDRLSGLSPAERRACEIVEHCLGVAAHPWDVAGRQGAVDAILRYPDGVTAAFEVTRLGDEGKFQLDSILARDDHEWPLPGDWMWSVHIGSARDVPKLKAVYEDVIMWCEPRGITRPRDVGWGIRVPTAVEWLIQESSSHMTGYPDLAHRSFAMVVPRGSGGTVDHQLAGFGCALAEAFASRPHIADHFEKLARAEHNHRHLFVILHGDVLGFGIMYELSTGTTLPTAIPPVPQHISDLWLVPEYSRRVLHWCRTTNGWQNFTV